MNSTFKTYDVVDYLKTERDMALYLEACFDEAFGDARNSFTYGAIKLSDRKPIPLNVLNHAGRNQLGRGVHHAANDVCSRDFFEQ